MEGENSLAIFLLLQSKSPHIFKILPTLDTSGQLNPFVVAILLVLSPTPRAARNYIPLVPKMLYLKKRLMNLHKLFCHQRSKCQNSIQWCQFGCEILKTVGPKMQDFCSRINMPKGFFLKPPCDELWFVKKCWKCTFKVNFLCEK